MRYDEALSRGNATKTPGIPIDQAEIPFLHSAIALRKTTTASGSHHLDENYSRIWPRDLDAWSTLLSDFKTRFRHGSLVLEPELDFRTHLSALPDSCGVYIIRGMKAGTTLTLYIGKAGTVTTTGGFRRQKLRGRLLARQRKVSRVRFLRTQLEIEGWENLAVHWFVTFEGDQRILPGKAEADLVQAYWDTFKRLPPWNQGF